MFYSVFNLLHLESNCFIQGNKQHLYGMDGRTPKAFEKQINPEANGRMCVRWGGRCGVKSAEKCTTFGCIRSFFIFILFAVMTVQRDSSPFLRAGAGLYFLYTNFYGDDRKHMDFFIRVNGTNLCAAFADMHSSGVDDNGTPSYGAVAQLTVGWLIMLFLLLMTLTCQWRIYIAKFCMGPQSNFLHFHAVSGENLAE